MAAGPGSGPIDILAPTRNTVNSTAAQLTATTKAHGVILKAICPGQTIYLGKTSAVTSGTGYPMSDGETLTLDIRNANQIFAIASADGQSLAILPFLRSSGL